VSGRSGGGVRWFQGALAALAIAGVVGLLVAARVSAAGRHVAEGALERDLRGVRVRTEGGILAALGPEGGGAVLVVSVTCPHCHATLDRIARASGGRPLPRLQVVAMEGAARGQTLLREMGIRAVALGPESPAGLARALHLRGVPLFLQTTPSRRVVRARIGALNAAEAEALVRISR
jgi:hypothetical protein